MKRILVPFITLLLAMASQLGNAQVCTPVNCSANLPSYGGICDTMLATGRVNQAYSDFESYVITGNCFDAGLISPPNAGTQVRITSVHNFTFAGQAAGLTGATNASTYTIPNGGTVLGCVRYQGTPTQVGVFKNMVNFQADIILCAIPITQNNNAASYGLRMTVLPDTSFTGLASTYCATDAPATLTVTGTPGGVFSGPGVSGNTFNPATAGVGTHVVKYKVSAQQGSAIAAATDSGLVVVTVVAPSYTYYLDNDNDGYGLIGFTINSCSSTPPAGYAPVALDCNDNNSLINPGSQEVCDNIDNNCNVQIDEGLPLITYYEDSDNDGFGNPTVITTSCVGISPGGYVTNDLDCDDNNNAINPNALEIPNNAVDENCDGNLSVVDNDLDGYNSDVDCNDNNNTVYPGAPELCDGIDNNCVGGIDEGLTQYTYYLDGDNDGYGSTTSTTTCAVTAPNGYVTNNTDCNDGNANIHPGATEVCDGVDNDCSGGVDNGLPQFTYYQDNDNDTYGDSNFPLITCASTAPQGYVIAQADCNDGNAAINPGASEACDGIDNNCDGNTDENLATFTYYRDFDTDGFGDATQDSVTCAANPPAGYVINNTDCNDADLGTNPAATEIPNNGIDEDCDGADLIIGINTLEAEFGIKVFPNPAQNFVTLTGKLTDNLTVTIYDLQGKQLYTHAMVQASNYMLDITNLKPGYYMLEVNNKLTHARAFTKIVVIK
jgi:hypothetical protein